MYGYIYKTTCLINNKIYVGQHKWPRDSIDPSYLGSGKILKEAVKLYGKENFRCEIPEWYETRAFLDIREKYWIEKLDSRNRTIGYNINVGGNSYDASSVPIAKGRIHVHNKNQHKIINPEELADYLSAGWQAGSVGRNSKAVICVETGEVYSSNCLLSRQMGMVSQTIRAYYLDKYPLANGLHYCYLSTYENWTEQQRADFLKITYEDKAITERIKASVNTKRAAKLRDSGNNLGGKRFINNGINCICVEESQFDEYFKKGYVIGRITSQQAHENMSKQIYCEELDTIFYSMTEASRVTGAQVSKISCCCHGTRKTANKYHFKFVNDPKQRGAVNNS